MKRLLSALVLVSLSMLPVSSALAQTAPSVVAPQGGDPQHGLPQSDDQMRSETGGPPTTPPQPPAPPLPPTATETPPGHPPIEPETPPGHPPIGASPGHGGRMRDPFDAPPVATSEPASDVPPGGIRVLVVDVEGRPVEGATVVLGTMQQGGDRGRVSALTDATGRHTWTDLPTGTGQAYRVTVPFEGATYGATPFQLPTDRGYQVRVVRLPTTHDDRVVLQVIGQTFVEIREERLHIIQQAQLANMSQDPQTYVFPEDDLRVQLPEGYLAFQTQPVMTDQRLEEVAGEGYRLRGSLPPGRVTLTFAYDVPITGSDMDVRIPVPFRTYIYRVITDAPPGMDLELDGNFGDPQEFEDQGRRLFGAELQRRPGDAPFDHVTLRFRGIPGPGPMRWVALAIALAMVVGGAFFVVRAGSIDEVSRRSREARKKQLLDEAIALDEQHARGEIGDQFRQSRRDAIVRELAVLLHQEKHARESAERKSAKPARVPARTES